MRLQRGAQISQMGDMSEASPQKCNAQHEQKPMKLN